MKTAHSLKLTTTFCLSDPKGFALEKNKCLSMEDHKNLSIHANVSLEFCAAKCRGISRYSNAS